MNSSQNKVLVAGNGEVVNKKSTIRKIAEKLALIIRARTFKNKLDHTSVEWCSGGVGPQGETYPIWQGKNFTERWSWSVGYEVILNSSATVDGKNGLVYTDARSGQQIRVQPCSGMVSTLCVEDTPEAAEAVAELIYAVSRFAEACEHPTQHSFEDLNA